VIQGLPKQKRVYKGMTVSVIKIEPMSSSSIRKVAIVRLFSAKVTSASLPPLHRKKPPLKISVVSRLVIFKISPPFVLIFSGRYVRKK
jgi:hypothetical protein